MGLQFALCALLQELLYFLPPLACALHGLQSGSWSILSIANLGDRAAAREQRWEDSTALENSFRKMTSCVVTVMCHMEQSYILRKLRFTYGQPSPEVS